MEPIEHDELRSKVREGYAAIAESDASCGCGTACCGSTPEVARELAVKLGYDPKILETLPEGTNLGLSCGNPGAIAQLKPGEVVMDLGSGAGFDVFLAAQAVGNEGFAIGVDMTPQMLTKARRNAQAFEERTGLDNVEFRLGEIENLPAADQSVDVVMSNCVINLSPNKEQVWEEIARVLVPGGRVAISDIVLRRPLPDGVFDLAESLVGCVAGAVLVDEMHEAAEAAGLVDIAIVLKPEYTAAMENFQDPLYFISSATLTAHVPCEGCDGDCDCGCDDGAEEKAEGCGCGPGCC